MNLASAPFRNRSLVWLGVAVALVLTISAGLAVMARSGHIDAEAHELAQEVAAQETKITALEKQIDAAKQAKASASLSFEDHVALDDARSLITRKSISWTQLLSELEHFVPGGSRLMSVSIKSVQGQGVERVVRLDLQLEGREQSELGVLLQRFDESGGRFRAEPVSITPSEEGPEVTYAIRLAFRPGLGTGVPLPPAVTVQPQPGANRQSGDEDDDND